MKLLCTLSTRKGFSNFMYIKYINFIFNNYLLKSSRVHLFINNYVLIIINRYFIISISIYQFREVDRCSDFLSSTFQSCSDTRRKYFTGFSCLRHNTSACLRKCLPRLYSESSPETTRLPPPQLTPNRSLTCLGLPDFAFSAVFPSSLSLFSPPPLSLSAFRSEILARNRHHGNDQGPLYCYDRPVV